MSSVDEAQVKPWYALRVKPRHEKAVSMVLRMKGHEELLPLYRSSQIWRDRAAEVELPLFAGYVFCRFSISMGTPVVTSNGVLGIVGFGHHPAAIDDAEIDALKRVVASRLNVEPWDYLEVGERVLIARGPLTGLEGILLETKKSPRILLSVNLLRRSVATEVDRDWLLPCDSRVCVAHA
jgi:transcription antitermination factor NusG